MADQYWNRPCAAPGLVSYRCKSRFGWIMIGALTDDAALAEALRSSESATRAGLERWNGVRYVPVDEK